jgi:hypothetical protein
LLKKISIFHPPSTFYFFFRFFILLAKLYTPSTLNIQMKLILLWVWAERAVLGRAKTALKFKYEIRSRFWKLKNHKCQKVSPVLKSLNKNLSYGTLKLEKIKMEVIWNLKSKKNFKSEKWFWTLPPQLKMPPAPLPPGKKNFLHPATSIDNASCTTTPRQKHLNFYVF